MPLVVPGLMSKDGNGSDDWMSKLMGKKLGDQHDEMVRLLLLLPSAFFAPLPLYSILLSLRECMLTVYLADVREDRSP
jgi:hypothetical protein